MIWTSGIKKRQQQQREAIVKKENTHINVIYATTTFESF